MTPPTPPTPHDFSAIETRVLGALIEKELSTPDHYPLSLNALTAACNQSSNREPVMALDEREVSGALDTLRRASLVRSFQSSGSRVPKFSHLLADAWELSRPELAVLGVLTLRAPQTLAEVRTRAGRWLPEADADAVEPALESLIMREPPLAVRLARRAGQKETRYAHTLGAEVVYPDDETATAPPSRPGDRVAALETSVEELRRELADLRAELAEFRKQFE